MAAGLIVLKFTTVNLAQSLPDSRVPSTHAPGVQKQALKSGDFSPSSNRDGLGLHGVNKAPLSSLVGPTMTPCRVVVGPTTDPLSDRGRAARSGRFSLTNFATGRHQVADKGWLFTMAATRPQEGHAAATEPSGRLSPSRGCATGRHKASGGHQRTRERPGMMTEHRRPPYPDRAADHGAARPAPGGLVGRAGRRSLLPLSLVIPLPYPLPCPAQARTAFPQHTTAFRCLGMSSQPSSLLLSLTKPWEIGGGGVSVVEAIIGFRARLVPSAAGRGRRPAGGRTRSTGGRG